MLHFMMNSDHCWTILITVHLSIDHPSFVTCEPMGIIQHPASQTLSGRRIWHVSSLSLCPMLILYDIKLSLHLTILLFPSIVIVCHSPIAPRLATKFLDDNEQSHCHEYVLSNRLPWTLESGTGSHSDFSTVTCVASTGFDGLEGTNESIVMALSWCGRDLFDLATLELVGSPCTPCLFVFLLICSWNKIIYCIIQSWFQPHLSSFSW